MGKGKLPSACSAKLLSFVHTRRFVSRHVIGQVRIGDTYTCTLYSMMVQRQSSACCYLLKGHVQ